MKNIIFLLFILSVACSCKNKTKNEVSPVQSDTKTETSINEDIVEEIFLTAPYPAEIHGIWGNTTFHKDLLKYNAVSKTLEFIKFDTDLKIGKDQILAMRPQYSEPHEFNSTKYALIAAGKDSLFVKNRSTGEKQLYVKLLDLPNEDLYSLYDDEYSAINLMEWNWFKGRYKYIAQKTAATFQMLSLLLTEECRNGYIIAILSV
ncbi:MAG: hypothetical protein ACLVKO_05410 [Dysgonomonas sp.]